MTASARGGGWALSFADLCLVLLCFFVLAQARRSDPGALAGSVRAAFGAPTAASERFEERAAALFQPGEAVLRGAARARLAALGSRVAREDGTVRVESVGRDAGGRRFDAWELAAARTAAVARAVASGGLAAERIAVAMPTMEAGPIAGQRIAVRQE